MSAVSKVFCIPELLEQILSSLPPLDIIRYQSVNYTWHRLIAESPLLQYQAWLRRDCPDPAHEVQDEDFEIIPCNEDCSLDEEIEYTMRAVTQSMRKHLNPVAVACFQEAMPLCPEDDWDGKFINLRPGYLRNLVGWYEAHKTWEDIWGNMSLCRPDVSAIQSSTGTSTHAGISFKLEAQHSTDPKHTNLVAWGVSHKRPGEPLILTLRDLLRSVEGQWESWLESERDDHWNSHDGAGCDYDCGLPSDSCLDHDEIEDEQSREYARTAPTFGTKRTMEEHIEALIDKTS